MLAPTALVSLIERQLSQTRVTDYFEYVVTVTETPWGVGITVYFSWDGN